MKKIIILVFSILLLISCSEELDNENKEYFSQEQLNALAESSPEALLLINGAVIDGTTAFLSEFSTNGGNIHDDFGQKSIDLGLDLMSNDVVEETFHWFGRYYNYTGREQTSRITDMIWNFYYKIIKNSNSIITQIPSDVSDANLRHVLARAKAMRGFAYFNLVRIYANGNEGIPLYTQAQEDAGRAPTADILSVIKSDYESAYALLYDFSRANKSEINQDVAAGLLARFYLETGDYSNAIIMANQAKDSAPLTDVTTGYDEVLDNEIMWGQEINSVNTTVYASYFSHIGNLNPGYAGLLNVYKDFDKRIFDNVSATDSRRAWLLGSAVGLPQYANTKFVDATFFEGDNLFMRGAEFHLILAEAKAMNGDDAGASQALYDIVHERDSGYALSSNTGTALLDEIKMQRKFELWGEGFAYYDMKRWNDPLVREYTGSNHPSFARFNFPANAKEFILQIPQDELDNNDNLDASNQNPL